MLNMQYSSWFMPHMPNLILYLQSSMPQFMPIKPLLIRIIMCRLYSTLYFMPKLTKPLFIMWFIIIHTLLTKLELRLIMQLRILPNYWIMFIMPNAMFILQLILSMSDLLNKLLFTLNILHQFLSLRILRSHKLYMYSMHFALLDMLN